jgi:hypothetical protein
MRLRVGVSFLALGDPSGVRVRAEPWLGVFPRCVLVFGAVVLVLGVVLRCSSCSILLLLERRELS